jgi:hypothetical protein
MYKLLKKVFKKHIFLFSFIFFPGLFLLLNIFFPVVYLFDNPIEKFQKFYPKFYIAVYIFVKGYFLPLVFIPAFMGLINSSKELREKLAYFLLLIVAICSNYYLRFYPFLFCFILIQSLLFALNKIEHVKSFYKKKFPLLKQHLLNFLYSLDNRYFKFLIWFWWVLVLVASCYRIAVVFYSDNLPENDAPIRFALSQMWVDYFLPYGNWSVKVAPNANWLPLQFYISGIIYKISNSLLAIRIFHATVGVLSAIWVWKISKQLFNKKVAAINTLAYLAYPASIYISVQVMSEPIFIFLSLAAVHYFLKFTASNNAKYLIIHVVFVNLASFIRFEAWAFPFIFGFLLLIVFKNTKFSNYLFLLLGFISPIIYIISITHQGFDALRWLTYSDYVVSFENSLYQKGWDGLREYKDSIIPFSILSTFLVGFYFRKNKNILALCLFGIIIFMPFLLKTFSFTLSFQLRYLIFYEVWFLFALSFGVWFLVKKGIKNEFISSLISAAVVLSLSAFGGRTIIGFENMRYDKEYFEAIDFVNNIDSCNLVLDHHNSKAYAGSYEFIASTRLPLAFPYNEDFLKNFIDVKAFNRFEENNPEAKKFIRFLVTDYYKVFENTDFDRLDSVINKFNNIYLVIFSEGELNKHFNFSKEIEEKNGVYYKRVFFREHYLIYKETYREEIINN